MGLTGHPSPQRDAISRAQPSREKGFQMKPGGEKASGPALFASMWGDPVCDLNSVAGPGVKQAEQLEGELPERVSQSNKVTGITPQGTQGGH